MVERLIIDRLGHRGDGVADGAEGPIYVAGTLPGETVEVENVPGQPDRRHLLNVEKPSAEAHRADLPAFRRLRRLRLAALGVARLTAPGSATSSSTALRQAGIEAPVGDLIDAHGDGRRRVVFHARRGGHDVLEVGFSAARAHQVIADRPLSGACQKPRRRADGGLGHRGSARARQKAARHPRDGDGCRARYRRARLGAADGRCNDGAGARRRAAKPGAADPPRRIDRAAARAEPAHGHGDRAVAARRVLAGDGRRRNGAVAARPVRWRRRKNHRRSVRRRRAVRAAARRAGARRRGR